MLRESAMAEVDQARVAADERHVGGLDGHVGAGPDGHAEVRLGERRRIVDAIADHGHDLASGLQRPNALGLVAGQDLGHDVVRGDADRARHARRRWPGCRR